MRGGAGQRTGEMGAGRRGRTGGVDVDADLVPDTNDVLTVGGKILDFTIHTTMVFNSFLHRSKFWMDLSIK